MPAIQFDASGDNVFLAGEDSGSGDQVVITAATSDMTTWSLAYQPLAGSACNIQKCIANADLMFFYGNFGTDVTVIQHTISTSTNTDISPSSLGAKVVNGLVVNPSDANEIVITVDTDQDVLYTSDGGSNWSTWDAALGFDATAFELLWSGLYFPHRYFVAGDNGADLDILYSPNAGANDTNVEDATVGALTNVCDLQVAEA